MVLEIYNTLSGEREEFKPIQDKRVRMYVCGVTVYDDIHMGHARSIIVFDMIARYLRYRGYAVTHLTNFTDVDDKIINRAAEMGIPPLELSKMYIDHYFEDIEFLGVRKADIYPKASESIEDIIKMVQSMVDKDLAYATDDGVYFDTSKVEDYGKLSGNKIVHPKLPVITIHNSRNVRIKDAGDWEIGNGIEVGGSSDRATITVLRDAVGRRESDCT
ncbi:MAG: class I tRNA ligase family protein [Methanomassiliicoccales archaeon]